MVASLRLCQWKEKTDIQKYGGQFKVVSIEGAASNAPSRTHTERDGLIYNIYIFGFFLSTRRDENFLYDLR